jgi:lipopolysaccharide export system permease protein|nr:MAG: hypothetical protein DIU52_05785 [bacterium]
MRILDRYVTREFLRLFLLFAVASPLMFVIFDITDNLDRHLARGIPPARVALSYVYQLPLFVLYAFPVAALIATIFTINNMARYSELTAAKAGGISFYRLIAPLPLLGVLLAGGALVLSEVVPVANRMRSEILGQRGRARTARTDFVYRTTDGLVFAIRRLEVESGEIRGISMEREGDEVRVPTVHATAEMGTFEPGRGWVLHDGYVRWLLGPDVERTFKFRSMRPRGLQETPEQLLAQPKDTEEMRYRELAQFIDIIERSGGRPLELRVELAQKIAIPVATLIIVLFAAPLATTAQRGGPAYGIGIALGVTLVYLMLFRIAGAAGATGNLPPVLAAWLPNIVFAVGAGILLYRART